ncbi:cell division protein FtsZ [Sphingomonas sp. HHU CXW]|uniref:Cell division protein FtsZ n=1 Tax=Sphingomonas hominis TaxID=2741495 RepID=A0ABX2JI42_9SPHN|nr:cell division protein FtsZ [Sphingomonas hominis]NTS65130.1 cell division protein FtsZ [Sphingomonas hominis]
MSIEFIAPDVDDLTPRITVVGVGGAGGNAIANMMRADVQGVNFLVANTDAQALRSSEAEQKIQLGTKITGGLGAGARPEIGRAAAEESIDELSRLLEGSHMCFIAAGMGGGTGTGAAPVIAKAARDMGILTVGVVTKPFSFEGNRRGKSADAGIEELQKFVDTLIVIPNQNLFLVANANTTFKQAFEMADEVLQQGVRGITDLMVMPGLINLDFADVRSVMQEMGKAMMGTGEADGDDRAIIAAQKAIANPLLDGVSMQGAKGVIVSITGGEDMRLLEVDEAANHIRELVDPDANIIWGSAFNPDLEGKIRVSVVATGIESAGAAGQPGSTAAAPSPAEPARPFSFSAPRRAEPAAAAPAPAPAPQQSYQPAPQPVTPPPQSYAAPTPTPVAPAPAAPAASAAPRGYTGYEQAPASAPAVASDALAQGVVPQSQVDTATNASDDELLLGSEAMLPEPTAPVPQATPAVQSGADQAGTQRRRFLAPETAEETPPQPRVKLGGTLFERMQNATRGAPRAGEAPAADAPASDLPRFLHRQNNQ